MQRHTSRCHRRGTSLPLAYISEPLSVRLLPHVYYIEREILPEAA